MISYKHTTEFNATWTCNCLQLYKMLLTSNIIKIGGIKKNVFLILLVVMNVKNMLINFCENSTLLKNYKKDPSFLITEIFFFTLHI